MFIAETGYLALACWAFKYVPMFPPLLTCAAYPNSRTSGSFSLSYDMDITFTVVVPASVPVLVPSDPVIGLPVPLVICCHSFFHLALSMYGKGHSFLDAS